MTPAQMTTFIFWGSIALVLFWTAVGRVNWRRLRHTLVDVWQKREMRRHVRRTNAALRADMKTSAQVADMLRARKG